MKTKNDLHLFDASGNAMANMDFLIAENKKLRDRVEELERRLKARLIRDEFTEERLDRVILN